jgi:tetratricopeptide (TPR) repeat protein
MIKKKFFRYLFFSVFFNVVTGGFFTLFIEQDLFADSHVYHKVNKLKETTEGEKLYSQGKYDDAIAMFNEAIKKGETRGEPHYYIGSIHESRHQYEEAIPFFQEAVKHDLLREFREATLWKLIILLRKQKSYAEMIAYIDLLEEFGVKHENLNKFREEAEVNLSPEKIKARQLIKDAKKLTSDWETNHKDEDFWTVKGNDDLRNDVLEKYTEAVSLDESLVNMYREIAGYYEKMANTQKAVQIYEKIIARNQDPQAYYKIGLIARKSGDFEKARNYFTEALKNLDENNGIKYYLLVNLSQVLYALADYENGIRYAREAKEGKKDEDTLYDNILYCLHMSRNKGISESPQKPDDNKTQPEDAKSVPLKNRNIQTSELKRQCESFVDKKDLAKKDVRFITLYRYMLGEVHVALLKSTSVDYKSATQNAVENYFRALIPQALRDAPLKELHAGETLESYEESRWAPLPLWCLVRLDHVAAFFKDVHADRELYITLIVYKKYLKDKNRDIYNENLAAVASRLELHEQSLDAYRQIKDRNFEQEKGMLKTYLHMSANENFQEEISHYLRLHFETKEQIREQIKNFLSTDPDAIKVIEKTPHDKLTDEIKNLMGIVDPPPEPVEIQTETQPVDQPAKEPSVPENNNSKK